MNRLDRERIEAGIDAATRRVLTDLEVFDSIDSTNTYLARAATPPPGRLRVAVADEQTAGRGRHNREWVSRRGQGLYQSIAYTVSSRRHDLSAMTLAMGVGIVEALAALGVAHIKLKWPNDLVADDAKLGGLLAETRMQGDDLVVIAGIGINISLDAETRRLAKSNWAQQAIALEDIAAVLPERNDLVSQVTNCIARTFSGFEAAGLAAYVERWRAADWLRGQAIRVESPTAAHDGIADGVDESGALLLRTETGTIPVTAGTVSLLGGVE